MMYVCPVVELYIILTESERAYKGVIVHRIEGGGKRAS